MSRRNQYAQVLRVVRQGPATSGEVALETGLERRACSAILHKLWKQGRVERSEKMIARARGPGAYLYTIRVRPHRYWTMEELRVLRSMAGAPARKVAMRLGRTERSVRNAADRNGVRLHSRQGPIWPRSTRQEARRMRRSGKSNPEISRALGVPVRTVFDWNREK